MNHLNTNCDKLGKKHEVVYELQEKFGPADSWRSDLGLSLMTEWTTMMTTKGFMWAGRPGTVARTSSACYFCVPQEPSHMNHGPSPMSACSCGPERRTWGTTPAVRPTAPDERPPTHLLSVPPTEHFSPLLLRHSLYLTRTRYSTQLLLSRDLTHTHTHLYLPYVPFSPPISLPSCVNPPHPFISFSCNLTPPPLLLTPPPPLSLYLTLSGAALHLSLCLQANICCSSRQIPVCLREEGLFNVY